MRWTEEMMVAVIEGLKEQFAKPENKMGDGYQLHAVRFEPDGDIALVHRTDEDEDNQYMITWMCTEWRTIITDGMIEDWSEDGQSPWWGTQAEYDKDKAQFDSKGNIYRLA